jgi:serine/threonine protein kinase
MPDENIKDLASGDLTGRTFGPYKIVEMLGRGGMATVYRAEQTSIGREVAIKIMPPHLLHNPTFLERFLREVQVIARLQHPRVLPIFDYGQLEGIPYIAMAYMPGGTLAERIAQGPLEVKDTVHIVEQVAEALDHAHNNGVIHRDFKPSNVLLDSAGNAYMADFGIAKISEATAELTGSAIIGTPSYMAPEMGEQKDITPAVDIYALGVTLYQMLTGELPYRGETPIRVMLAHVTDPVPDVRHARSELPPGVSDVIRKAMAKDPAERYPSAGALAADLEEAVYGEPKTEAIAWPAKAPDEAPPRLTQPVPPTPQPFPAPEVKAPPPDTAPPVPTPEIVPVPEKKRACRPMALGFVAGIVALIGLCIGLVWLGNQIGTDLTPTPDTPTEAPATEIPTEAVPAGVNVKIVNNSDDAICFVYIAPSGAKDWGEEQLGEDRVIAAGGSFTLTGLPPDTYDLQAEDCNHETVARDYGVELDAEDFTWTISGVEGAKLILENRASLAICYLYVTPDSSDGWGPDQLGEDNVVDSGEDFTLTDIPPGTYDLRAESCEGKSAEHQDAEIETEFTWTIND